MSCPNVLANGLCSDTTCKYMHNIPTCEHCQLVFDNNDVYEIHLKCDKHRSRVRGTSFDSFCAICTANITGGNRPWTQHVNGKRHLKKASAKGVSPKIEPQGPASTAKANFCDLCNYLVQVRYWTSHMNGKKHKMRETYARYRSMVQEAELDKNGISVTGQFDFEFVDPPAAVAGVRKVATITTSIPNSRVTLVDLKLASSHEARLLVPAFSVSIDGPNRILRTSTPVNVIIFLKQSYIGRYEDRLEFIFRDDQLRRTFMISRALKAIVANRAEYEQYRPRAPYIPRTRTTRQEITNVVEGIPPPALTKIKYIHTLPRADIPSQLKVLLYGTNQSRKSILQKIEKVFMPQVLNSQTYGRHFRHLLWIEEAKMEDDLERYDISGATLTRYNQYFYLPVPGLAEKRPSVLVGDRILVQEVGSINGRWFEGHVHDLRQSEVGLVFHGSFNRSVEGKHYYVRFKLNRIPLRRQHQAMDTIFTEDRILFPTNEHMNYRLGRIQPRLFNQDISTNAPQLRAVASILSSPAGSPTFVVFGPPGTGKTITILEAIRQVLAEVPDARILACAPSNSAADLIASRLRAALTPSEMFRFYALSRSKAQVSHSLLPYTCMSDGHFTVPTLSRLKRYNVVVSTCVSASFAAGIGMPRGHFTHIFIDEAGQATEPEAFVSIKTLADSQTNVILSGDPRQLGPIIRSPIARDLGLEVSYLERLMSQGMYVVHTGSRSVVKLTKNFRSHNAILSFPNAKFYDNELVPSGCPSTINKYLNSSYLPAKEFPIVFHAVSGKDDREASSPSFFNVNEILQVKSYVQKLKEDRNFRTTDADIGVIAPYHAQCLKLRNALRSVADGVKVGSVEEFQGQERRVIIISTVRSSKEFVEYDLRHTLGFVANPRRFNVAVTRAQSLLIIIGDPQVLSLDPLWRSFLNYIHNNGGWTGPDITWDPQEPVNEAGGYDQKVRDAAKDDMNEFTRLMEACTVAKVDNELDANVDRPWRNVE